MAAKAESLEIRADLAAESFASSLGTASETTPTPDPAGLLSRVMLGIRGRYRSPRALTIFSLELVFLSVTSFTCIALGYGSFDDAPMTQVVAEQSLILAGLYLGVFYMMDLYNFAVLTTRRAWMLNLAQAVGILSVIFGFYESTAEVPVLAPPLALLNLVGVTSFVVVERSLVDRVIGSRRPLITLAVLGESSVARQVAAEASKYKDLGLAFEWVGDNVRAAAANVQKLLDDGSNMRRVLMDPGCFSENDAADFLFNCRRLGIEVEDLAEFCERAFGRAALGPALIRDLALSPSLTKSKVSIAFRRLFDVVLALLGLLLSAPVTVLVAVAIKCDSPGPVFFYQDRVGRNGRVFKMIKFRSMHSSAKQVNGYEWTTHAGDPRITRVGAFIRKLHLDEVPQLLNVLVGEMSLVGPRPFHRAQVAHLQDRLRYFKLRELVAPGITGWAQVRCDYAASVENQEEVLARDLYYVKHAGVLFDLLILMETIRIVLWRRGAR